MSDYILSEKNDVSYDYSAEKEIVCLEFDSAEDYIEACLTNDVFKITDKDWTYGSVKTREQLVENLTIGKSSKKVRDFFEKYREEVEQQLDITSYLGQGLSSKRVRRCSDDGDELNIDKVMVNRDDYWDKMVRDNKRRNVRIGINFSLAHFNDEMEFARLGATASVLADILTRMGNAVEIHATYCCQYEGSLPGVREFVVLFPVKRSHEVLDLQRVMSIATNGILRDLLFQIKRGVFGFDHGMGYQKEMSEDAKERANVFYVVEQKDTKSVDATVDTLDREIRKLAETMEYSQGHYK